MPAAMEGVKVHEHFYVIRQVHNPPAFKLQPYFCRMCSPCNFLQLFRDRWLCLRFVMPHIMIELRSGHD